MGFFSYLFNKAKPAEKLTAWPNHPTWGALKNGETIQTEDGPRFVWTVPCGELLVPSGRLVACDPFAYLEPKNNPCVRVPKGKFPVVVTLADVSKEQDKSQIREAYASIIFSSESESNRRAIPLLKEGEIAGETKGDEFIGFDVDAGTACFVDDSVVERCMPAPSTWYEDLFDNPSSESWFSRMDDPNHIREGIANIRLPLGTKSENLILFHSGWGDGCYPVIGSFDSSGEMIAAHIDFFVL